MSDCGVPDWRDPKTHPKTDSWNLSQWRWEFLRRRDDYRKDFQTAAQEIGTTEVRFSHETAGIYELEEFFAPWVSEWKFDGPVWRPLPLPNLDDEGLPAAVNSLSIIYFDLSKPLGPQLVAARDELEFKQASLNLSIIETAQLAYGAEYSGHPEIPLDVILEKLKKKLFAPKHQMSKWPLYLRVLDAHEAGASYAEISTILPVTNAGTKQSARDVLKAAKGVRF